MTDASTGTSGTAVTSAGWKRWVPLVALAAFTTIAFAMGWHKYLTFKTIGLNYEALQGFIGQHRLAALAIYVATYVGVVALSLPCAGFLTISSGLLFGWTLGVPATVIGATAGATVIFLIARSSLGNALGRKAGPWLERLRGGFKENALSYLLFLRLVPAFPFVVVNLAAAILGVPLRTYVLGTALGIIPGTIAFSFAGAGLGSVVEAQNAAYKACLAKASADLGHTCPYSVDTSALVTKELLVAFVLLGLVALIPVVIRKWSSRHGDA